MRFIEKASMRPPDLPGGNPDTAWGDKVNILASMRPPDLPGGNHQLRHLTRPRAVRASMRPPDLPGGNKKKLQRLLVALVELQ